MMSAVGPCKQAQSSCPLLLLQDFVSIINKAAGPNLAVQCNELFHLLLFVQQYFFLTNTFLVTCRSLQHNLELNYQSKWELQKSITTRVTIVKLLPVSRRLVVVRQLGTNIPWLNGTYSLLFMFKFNNLHVCFGFGSSIPCCSFGTAH